VSKLILAKEKDNYLSVDPAGIESALVFVLVGARIERPVCRFA
jgi:hypothetical protein